MTVQIMFENYIRSTSKWVKIFSITVRDVYSHPLLYETMSENIDMTDVTYCKTCSLRIDVLSYKDVSVSKFHIGGRVYMQLVK